MTAKEWLRRGWKIDREISALLREKEETRARLLSVTAQLDRPSVQATKDPHKFDVLVEYDAWIVARVDELVRVKQEITETISRVEDSRYRTLLTARYLSFRTWEQICVDLSYSWRQVHRVHAEALSEIDSIVKDGIEWHTQPVVQCKWPKRPIDH